MLLLLASAALAQQRTLKPGFNLFKKEQDIQLGKEYSAQIEKQTVVVNDAELNGFVERIGRRLASTPEADGYPYTFKVVQDKSINAFALPGGPTYTHTGLVAAAENEAQIAGVLAHEVAHVALRHGTNQASKAQMWQLLGGLGGAAAGGGLTGTLAQMGIGLGVNSVLLRFSRDAERDADLLGTRIMARAGSNPIEMARFFEKLEAEAGKGSRVGQWFSDHPNPGNRVKAVQDEIRYLQKREYSAEVGQLPQMKTLIARLPDVKPPAAAQKAGDPQLIPQARPSTRLREYKGKEALFSYPENWDVAHAEGNSVTIAPKAGLVGGGIGYGMIANIHESSASGIDAKTQELVQVLIKENQGMKQSGNPSRTRVNGADARVIPLESPSPYQGLREVDTLVVIERPRGLFYMVLIAPDRDYSNAQKVFNPIIGSIRFPN